MVCTMIPRITVAMLLTVAAIQAQTNSPGDEGQPFRLGPGDFRWMKIAVRQTPAEVECHFTVIEGNPSVHVELLPMSEFRRFDRGLEHDTLVATPDGRKGDFRRIIDVNGQYAVVVVNGKRSPPATVSLQVRTSLNPKDVALTLSPTRRLTVILISFAFFFVTLTWSARKLIRGMRPG